MTESDVRHEPREPDYWPEPPRRGGSGCLKGCLITAAIMLVLTVIAIIGLGYMAYQVTTSVEDDPTVLSQWLTEVSDMTPPPDYRPLTGLRFMGMTFIVIAPINVKEEIDAKAEPKPAAKEGEVEEIVPEQLLHGSFFVVLSAKLFNVGALRDALDKQLESEIRGPDKKKAMVKSTKTDLRIGDQTIEATRTEISEDDKRLVFFDVIPRPGLIIRGIGPADKFDIEAFKKMIGSGMKEAKEGAPAEKTPSAKAA